MYNRRGYNRSPTNRSPTTNRGSITNPFLEYKTQTTQAILDIMEEIQTIKTKVIDINSGTNFTLNSKLNTLEGKTTQLENNIENHSKTLSNQENHFKMMEDTLVKLNTLEEDNGMFVKFIEDFTIKYRELFGAHTIYQTKIDQILNKENTHTSAILEEVASLNKSKTQNIIVLLEQLINQNKEQATITSLLAHRLDPPTEATPPTEVIPPTEVTPPTEATPPTEVKPRKEATPLNLQETKPKKRKYIRKKH